MTYAAVGSDFGGQASGALVSFSVTTAGAGNFVLAEVISQGATRVATGLSSTHATWVALGTPVTTSVTIAAKCQVFLGTVTSAATATVTITWGAGAAGSFENYAGREFSTTTGIPVLDVQGTLDNAGGTSWPSLTPAAAGELYFGYGLDNASAVAGSTSGYTYDANVDGHTDGMAFNPSCGASATSPAWGAGSQECAGVMVLVMPAAAAAGGGIAQAQPGRTWLRRFRHRQQLTPPVVIAAAAPVSPPPPMRPVIISRAAARARTGPSGRPGGGVASAVVTPLGAPARPRPFVFRSPVPARARTGPAGSPGDGNPSSVVTPLGSMPRPMPRPVIQHLPPSRGQAGPMGLAGAGLASSTVTPRGTPGPQWRAAPRRPAPSRAVWHGGAAPQAIAPVITAYRRPPAQFPRRPPARALWHGGASSIITPRGTPGPAWRPQPRRPAPARAVWHGNAGPAAIVPPAAQAYQRPAPQIRRPGPARAIVGRGRTGGGQAGPANLAPVTTAAARPPAQPRSRPPQRAVWHGNASQIVTPLGAPARRPGPVITSRPRSRGLWHGGTGPAPPPASAPPPRWRPLPSRRRPQRGTWRSVRSTANLAAPPFSIGALTAADTPGAVLTAAGAASTLTAGTAASGTLTATDQRTGGPG